MLLLRIRTELKQTLMSYQVMDADDAYDVMMMSYQELFEKSIVWGRQKVKYPVRKNI